MSSSCAIESKKTMNWQGYLFQYMMTHARQNKSICLLSLPSIDKTDLFIAVFKIKSFDFFQ